MIGESETKNVGLKSATYVLFEQKSYKKITSKTLFFVKLIC